MPAPKPTNGTVPGVNGQNWPMTLGGGRLQPCSTKDATGCLLSTSMKPTGLCLAALCAEEELEAFGTAGRHAIAGEAPHGVAAWLWPRGGHRRRIEIGQLRLPGVAARTGIIDPVGSVGENRQIAERPGGNAGTHNRHALPRLLDRNTDCVLPMPYFPLSWKPRDAETAHHYRLGQGPSRPAQRDLPGIGLGPWNPACRRNHFWGGAAEAGARVPGNPAGRSVWPARLRRRPTVPVGDGDGHCRGSEMSACGGLIPTSWSGT